VDCGFAEKISLGWVPVLPLSDPGTVARKERVLPNEMAGWERAGTGEERRSQKLQEM